MIRYCQLNGCGEKTAGYSKLCQRHKQNQHRHGEAQQRAITKAELRPYGVLVEARKAKNPDSEAWRLLSSRWTAVVDGAGVTLQRYAEGQVSNRIALRAAHQIVTVASATEPWEVVRTVLAMYLMRDQQPRRFTSDIAFNFQMVRRVRGLAPANAGTYWDPKEGRSRRVYRDVPPRVVAAMAQVLNDALGAAGLMLAQKQRQETDKAAEERHRLADAMESLS